MNRTLPVLIAVIALVGCDPRVVPPQSTALAPDHARNGVQIETAIPASDAMVYINSSGSVYHREDCHHATNAKAIPLSKAGAYKPCKVCKARLKAAAKSEATKTALEFVTAGTATVKVVGLVDGDTIDVLTDAKRRFGFAYTA